MATVQQVRVTIYDATERDSLKCALADLPRTEVDVLPGWSVADVLEAGGYMPYLAFALVTAEMEADLSAGEGDLNWFAGGALFGVDDEGALQFQGERHITWMEFTRAADEFHFPGDPTRIVVYPQGVAGGPIPDGLWDAVQWLFDNRDVGFGVLKDLGEVAIVAGATQVVRRVRGSRRKSIAEQWRKQGITGPRLFAILAEYPHWDPARIEKLFGLESLEARLMLTNAGYRCGTDGLWRPSQSLDAQRRRGELDRIERRADDDIEKPWSDEFPAADD